MKCPFRITKQYIYRGQSSDVKEEIEQFGDCYEDSCPYYTHHKDCDRIHVSLGGNHRK